MTLARSDYVQFAADGTIDKIFCKMCGVVIASVEAIPIGSGPRAGKFVMHFQRHPNYVDAKFVFDDGHFHVTNGCKNCINMSLTSEQLEELHTADLGLMPGVDATPDSTAIEVVAIDATGVGIL